jgi:hypothetical protein
MELPKLPDWRKAMPKMPKLAKLPDPRQQVQGSQGAGQGWWGIYAPRVSPMSNRRKPTGG